jgi:hypothetical protein
VHDQATGQVVMQMTMSSFWMFVPPSNTLVLVTPNDPRMRYDIPNHNGFDFRRLVERDDLIPKGKD